MNQAIRKLSGLLVLPVLLAALLLMPVQANAKAASYQCTATLPVNMELNGDSDELFTVTIAPGPGAEDTLPMPEQTELQMSGDSTAAFTGFRYTEPGDYVYTVTQTAGSTDYMTYDDVVYTVVIQVTNAENGGLTYQVYASRDDNPTEKVAEVSFLNTYAPPPPETSEPEPSEPETSTPVSQPSVPTDSGVPQTGDTVPLLALTIVVLVAAGAIVVLVVVRGRSGKQNGRH